MALNVKKGDNVVIIAGKDKGKTGKVLVAMPADGSVVVAGVNMIAKHKKPRNANDKGGIIKKEGKIDASNVQIICPTCGKATRVAHELKDNKKIRKCKKCGADLDVVVAKKATKDTATKTTKKVETTEKTVTEEKPAAKKTTISKTATKSSSTKKTTSTSEVKKETTKTTTKKSTTKKVESK